MISNIASSIEILLCLESMFLIKGEGAIISERCLEILENARRARVSAHRHRERQSSQHHGCADDNPTSHKLPTFQQDDSISHECALKALGVKSPRAGFSSSCFQHLQLDLWLSSGSGTNSRSSLFLHMVHVSSPYRNPLLTISRRSIIGRFKYREPANIPRERALRR